MLDPGNIRTNSASKQSAGLNSWSRARPSRRNFGQARLLAIPAPGRAVRRFKWPKGLVCSTSCHLMSPLQRRGHRSRFLVCFFYNKRVQFFLLTASYSGLWEGRINLVYKIFIWFICVWILWKSAICLLGFRRGFRRSQIQRTYHTYSEYVTHTCSNFLAQWTRSNFFLKYIDGYWLILALLAAIHRELSPTQLWGGAAMPPRRSRNEGRSLGSEGGESLGC